MPGQQFGFHRPQLIEICGLGETALVSPSTELVPPLAQLPRRGAGVRPAGLPISRAGQVLGHERELHAVSLSERAATHHGVCSACSPHSLRITSLSRVGAPRVGCVARRSRLAAAREAAGHTQESLAAALGIDRTTPGRWEQNKSDPRPGIRPALAVELKVHLTELDDVLAPDPDLDSPPDWTTVAPPALDDLEAIELIRRAEASDVGPATMAAVETGADLLCRSYTSTPPADLLVPLRAYRGYAVRLLDGRTTLAQRRQLTVVAGWLSLLAAICHIDLRQHRPAALNLDAAQSMASEADDRQLAAWAFETRAWQALTDADLDVALDLCRTGRDLVAAGTSAHVQLTVQAARTTARLGQRRETHQLLDDAARSLDRMPVPEHPEHHFQFDPRKLVGYRATTLAWLGNDPDAEEAARLAVDQYDINATDGRWVRRLALARIDLALVLAGADQPDEAIHLTGQALDSGRMVASNLWRLDELDRRLDDRFGPSPAVTGIHDRYVDLHHQLVGTPPPRALGTG